MPSSERAQEDFSGTLNFFVQTGTNIFLVIKIHVYIQVTLDDTWKPVDINILCLLNIFSFLVYSMFYPQFDTDLAPIT